MVPSGRKVALSKSQNESSFQFEKHTKWKINLQGTILIESYFTCLLYHSGYMERCCNRTTWNFALIHSCEIYHRNLCILIFLVSSLSEMYGKSSQRASETQKERLFHRSLSAWYALGQGMACREVNPFAHVSVTRPNLDKVSTALSTGISTCIDSFPRS